MIPNLMGGGIHIQIIENVSLTQDGDPVQVKRTWRERLLTRPWRPWRTMKTVVPKVPYQGGYFLNRHTVMMHPAIAKTLKDQIERGVTTKGRT